MKIAGLVLAAGGSARLGEAKQLLRYQGDTLVRRAAAAALAGGCAQVVIVVGRDRQKIERELNDLAVQIVPNESWKNGIGSSIYAGLAVLTDCDAVVILTADQPRVGAAVIRRLIARQEETQKPMVACAYSETIGVPAFFARALFPELLALRGEKGAKSLLTSRPAEVARIDFAEGEIDIDTPEDLERIE